MLKIPKTIKFEKIFRHRKKTAKQQLISLKSPCELTCFIISLDYTVFYNYHIEMLRRFIIRKLPPKSGKTITNCRIALTLPLTKKSSKARMGKGRGSLHSWTGRLYPGKIIYEFKGKNAFIIYNKLKDIYFLNKKLKFRCKAILQNNRLNIKEVFSKNPILLKKKNG